jgi:hypothetical protein
MSKVIELIVSPTGQTKIETKGFSGSECQAASTSLEAALGQRRSERLTAEFHKAAPTGTRTSLEQ